MKKNNSLLKITFKLKGSIKFKLGENIYEISPEKPNALPPFIVVKSDITVPSNFDRKAFLSYKAMILQKATQTFGNISQVIDPKQYGKKMQFIENAIKKSREECYTMLGVEDYIKKMFVDAKNQVFFEKDTKESIENGIQPIGINKLSQEKIEKIEKTVDTIFEDLQDSKESEVIIEEES